MRRHWQQYIEITVIAQPLHGDQRWTWHLIQKTACVDPKDPEDPVR